MVKCSESVDRGDGRWPHFEPCGRDAVEDTNPPLCKLHLRVQQNRNAEGVARKAEQERGEAFIEKATELAKKLGIPVAAEYRVGFTFRSSGYTGRMVVPLEWLEEVAAKFRK